MEAIIFGVVVVVNFGYCHIQAFPVLLPPLLIQFALGPGTFNAIYIYIFSVVFFCRIVWRKAVNTEQNATRNTPGLSEILAAWGTAEDPAGQVMITNFATEPRWALDAWLSAGSLGIR